MENRVRVKMAQTCCYQQSSCCAGKQRCLLEAGDKVMDITLWVYYGMARTVLTFMQECLTACQDGKMPLHLSCLDRAQSSCAVKISESS